MGQKQKNISLMVVLAVLVLCSIIFSLTDSTTSNTISNKTIFNVQDTASIDMISIKSAKEMIELSRNGGPWMVNNKTKAEQSIVKVLLSILKDMEVIRSVAQAQENEIAEFIVDNGFLVEISGNGELLNSFYSSGNENKTVSYMMSISNRQPYIVSIPGYGSYIAGIFEIPENDWRERLILSTNWRTLQNLKIDYADYPEYDFEIRFKFNFLGVEGIDRLDTARMMNFIEGFNYLQADRYLSEGELPQYDSLQDTPHTVSLTVQDIDASNSKTIRFYPLLKNDDMMLAYIEEDRQMVLFRTERIQGLFAVKSDFELPQ